MHILRDAELPDISAYAPFKALVVTDGPVSRKRQAEISAWLVDMGCRYMMSYGENCDSWCASVRQANLERFNLDSMSARDFVMTTGHPVEPMRWMLWFAKKMAKHPEIDFKDFIMLDLGDRNRSAEFDVMYRRA